MARSSPWSPAGTSTRSNTGSCSTHRCRGAASVAYAAGSASLLLVGEPLGEARLPDPDRGSLPIHAPVHGRLPALLVDHPARDDRADRGQEEEVAEEPHQAAGDLLVLESRRPPGP